MFWFHPFTCSCPVSPAVLTEEIVFSLLYILATPWEKPGDSHLNAGWVPFQVRCLERNPTFLWDSKGSLTPLMQLKKLPNIPVSTWEEHRGSCHNSRRSPYFPPHLELRVHFPASLGKGIPVFLSHLKRRHSQLDAREELQGSCHNSNGPQCHNAFQIHLIPLHWLDCHPEYRLKTRCNCDSHVAAWEKATDPMSARQEAWHYFDSLRGKWTCMSRRETKPDSPVETP